MAPSFRPLTLGVVLAAGAALVAACGNLIPQDLRVPKLYFSDYKLDVTARPVSGKADPGFEEKVAATLQQAHNVGILYTPEYTFIADPVLLLQMTEPVDVPASEMVTETEYVDGEAITRQVLRKPLFYIDKATITYSVTGYEIPTVTVTEQLPVKATQYELPLPAAAQANALMSAFADNREREAIAGTMTVTVDVRDLDPLAPKRSFQVSRTLPLVYSFSAITKVEATPTPAPTASPTPTPSPSPTPSPTPTPTPSPTPTPAAT